MIKYKIKQKTGFNVNNSNEGETIETKVMRIVSNKEAITDGAQLMYTERSMGVMPEYNPRTDKFEVALEAMDKAHKSDALKRESTIKNDTKIVEDESTQDTENNQ